MAALFNSKDWVDKENDLNTVIGSGTNVSPRGVGYCHMASSFLVGPCACPVTSCEKLITPDRNALGDGLIEALECLKAWWDNGLILRY
jgi:hypothetical protein